MTPESLTSVRELDSRFSDGIQVSLWWCKHDGRVWVSVLDTKTRDAFCLQVLEGERPLDVFHHPYAYARQHGTVTVDRPVSQADQPLAA